MIHDGRNRVQGVLTRNLRRLRIARHLSLSELARATGMSKATLSGIENGRANPTLDTLASLAGALRVSLVELLEEPPLGEVRVVRAPRGVREQDDGKPARPFDTIGLDGTVEVAELALSARQTHEREPSAEGSRAHLYVLQGKLIAGPVERITELAPGDYASFPTDVPHTYEAPRTAARALLLTYTPSRAAPHASR
jgi:transcriptional regulator with XRE-family HTH domain